MRNNIYISALGFFSDYFYGTFTMNCGTVPLMISAWARGRFACPICY